MNMISIDEFVSRKKLKFKTEKSKVAWFKKLKAESLVKLGDTYFINRKEAEQLLAEDLVHKIKIKKQRAIQAKINFRIKKKRKIFPKRDEAS